MNLYQVKRGHPLSIRPLFRHCGEVLRRKSGRVLAEWAESGREDGRNVAEGDKLPGETERGLLQMIWAIDKDAPPQMSSPGRSDYRESQVFQRSHAFRHSKEIALHKDQQTLSHQSCQRQNCAPPSASLLWYWPRRLYCSDGQEMNTSSQPELQNFNSRAVSHLLLASRPLSYSFSIDVVQY